jgi:putative aminopeptidase FrvX
LQIIMQLQQMLRTDMLSRNRLLSICRATVSQPTASFHEYGVRDHLTAMAMENDLPTALDRFGNLFVRYQRGNRQPEHTLIAHMDHPGFVVTGQSRKRQGRFLTWCRWFGRVANNYFRGEKVRINSAAGPVQGKVTAIRTGGELGRVEWICVATATSLSPGEIGSWNLPVWDLSGDRLRTLSADDLIGCAVLMALLEHLAAEELRANVTVVFTRAEEAGLVGATALAHSGIIPRGSPILSLETSMEKPAAVIGGGVVLRTGDIMSNYDPGLCAFLLESARSVQQRNRRFCWQRCLMDGGTTESSSFAAYGYRASGLAFAMGNYHNMGPKRITPEEVSVSDLMGGLALLTEYVTRRWPASGWPAAADTKRLRRISRQGEAILRDSLLDRWERWPASPAAGESNREGSR